MSRAERSPLAFSRFFGDIRAGDQAAADARDL
jgi:hypothetical protein